MNKKEFYGQQKLKFVLGEYEMSFIKNYPPAQISVSYSERYKKKIGKLLSNKKTVRPGFWCSLPKRVAVILVAVCMAVSFGLTIYALREPMVEFFTNVYERFVEIFFNEDDIEEAPTYIETLYTLGYIPEGYEMESIVSNDIRAMTTLSNGKFQIIFLQYLLDGKTDLDNEDSNLEFIYIDSLKIASTEKNGQKTLFWNTDEYSFKLILSIDISYQEYIAIIKSITQYENN